MGDQTPSYTNLHRTLIVKDSKLFKPEIWIGHNYRLFVPGWVSVCLEGLAVCVGVFCILVGASLRGSFAGIAWDLLGTTVCWDELSDLRTEELFGLPFEVLVTFWLS
jgi:hypothetical protein